MQEIQLTEAGKAKALKVKTFVRNLTFSKGKWAGQPFVLLPWQERLIDQLFGVLRPDGLRQYRTAYLEIPKKNGKALSIETDIPTPQGWKKMADIQSGDFVFDEQGRHAMVTFTTEVTYGHECYEVTFSDGEKITADAEHLWKTHNHGVTGRKNGLRIARMSQQEKSGIHTTRHLLKTLKVGRAANHQVDCTAPLLLPEKILGIAPYTLGAWLGDGKNQNSEITSNDQEVIDAIRADGYRVTKSKEKYAYWIHGLNPVLRRHDLLYNKHIPSEYLRASCLQRLALLQGLMDTDGSCGKKGECEFSNTSKKLTEGFFELLRTLGYKPNPITTKIPKLNGKPCKLAYRVTFFGRKEAPPFRLPRKLDRLKDVKITSRRRRITNIVPVESVPVKCITVDSPSSLYLCGRGFIPTHNSELGAALALYMLCADNEGAPEIYGAATEREQASLLYNAAATMVRNSPVLSKVLKIRDSRKRIIYPKNGGYYQVLSSEAYSKHGSSPHAVFFDEIHAMPDGELWETLTAGTDYARSQQLIFVMTTAGIYSKESLWWRLRSKAQQIDAGIVDDPRFLPVLYLADPDKDRDDDEQLWRRVNPSLGQIFDFEKIREDHEEAKRNPVDLQNFRRFRLNIPVRQISKWMPMDKWDACSGQVDGVQLPGRQCFGGLDLSLKLDMTAFVMVFCPAPGDDTYDVLCRFYCPEEGIIKRSHIDRVNYDIWQQQGYLIATPGETVDYEFIERDLCELIEKWNIIQIGFDPWKATSTYNRIMAKYNPTNDEHGFQMIEVRQGARSMHEPAQDLLVKVVNGKVRHGGHPVLRWNMDNLVMRSDANENLAPDKAKAVERVDGAVALIMAWGRAILSGKEESVYEDRGVITI